MGFLWEPQRLTPSKISYPIVDINTLEYDLPFVHLPDHSVVLKDKLCYSKSDLKFGR